MDRVGIDIGGTKIAGARVDADGVCLASASRATTPESASGIVQAVAELVAEVDDGAAEGAIGVAVAAFLDRERRRIFFSPNIHWSDYPIADELEQVLGRPVVVENDANAAGWAEYRFGAGQGAHSMMMLTMGTGVGGALVDEGRLLRGGFGAAGELGHIVIEPGGLLCGCGNRGCLEQYASGTALMRIARERLGEPELTPDSLAAYLGAGDSRAHEALDAVCDAMGRGIASLVVTTDPDVVVIGGGVARAGEDLADRIYERYLQHYPASSRRPVAKVLVARLGNTAGVIGAADLARLAAGPGL